MDKRSCPCGNVRVSGSDALPVVTVEFPGLMRASPDDPELLTCGLCGLATHTRGGSLVGGGAGLVPLDSVKGRSEAFGVRVRTGGSRGGGLGGTGVAGEATVQRMLEAYVRAVKAEAERKISDATVEAAALLRRMVGGVPPTRRPVAAGATGTTSLGRDDGALGLAKSAPPLQPPSGAMWALDEELSPRAAAPVATAAFPPPSDSDDAELNSSDPFKSSDPLLPSSRRILFGSSNGMGDEAGPSEKLALAHSLPVAVPSMGGRRPGPPVAAGAGGRGGRDARAEEDTSPEAFERPDVVAANTWQEQLRSEWISQSKLGQDDADFLMATKVDKPKSKRFSIKE